MPVIDQQIETQAMPGRAVTRQSPLHTSGRRSPVPLTPSADGRELNPDELGFTTLDRMRSEPTIATGLRIISTTILRQVAQARIDCDDPSIKRFLEATLLESGLWYRTMRTSLHALWAGMQAAEKVWDVQELNLQYEEPDAADPTVQTTGSAWQGPALVIKELRELAPTTITAIKRRVAPQGSTARVDAQGRPYDGSFDGFYWRDPAPALVDAAENEPVWVQPQKAFLYSHDAEFGNLWGKPRTRYAYSNYHWLDYTLKAWVSWEESKVAAHKVARYPQGVSEIDGQEVDNAELAADFGDALDNATIAVIPSTRDDKGYLWDLEEHPNTDKTATWKETAIYHEDRELRAIFVPNKVFENQEVGSYSAVNAYQDFFLLTQDTLLDELGDNGNAYVTKPLVVANFGNNVPDAKVVMPGLADPKQARLAQVLQSLLADPTFLGRIDEDQVAEDAEIPLKQADAPAESIGPGAGAVPAVPAGSAPPAAPAGAAPPAAPVAPAEPVLPAGSNVAAADIVLVGAAADAVALAGWDPLKWTITPDPNSPLHFAVHYATGPFAGRRLAGFAAGKVIESWQKAAGTAAKKGAADQARAQRAAAAATRKQQAEQARQERAAAAAAKKSTAEQTKAAKAGETAAKRAEAAATAESKRQEREALKVQKEQERQQRDAQRQQDQQQRTTLAAARAERAQMEITTRRQDPAGVAQTLASRGWQQQGGVYADRQAAEAAIHSLAAQATDHTYTVMTTKGGFVIIRKPTAHLTTPRTSPNVAADDTGSDSPPPIEEPNAEPVSAEAALDAAAARLTPLFTDALDTEKENPL